MRIRIKGHSLSISYPFAAMLAFSMVFDKTGAAAGCVFAAFLHEIGHILCMMMFDNEKIDIRLSLFDFKITDRCRATRSKLRDIAIYSAGPAANLALFAALWRLPYTHNFAAENLIIGLFNLLPVGALDGGCIIRSALSGVLEETAVTKILKVTSVLTVFCMAVLGVKILTQTGYNFTLLLAALYLSALCLFEDKHNI